MEMRQTDTETAARRKELIEQMMPDIGEFETTQNAQEMG